MDDGSSRRLDRRRQWVDFLHLDMQGVEEGLLDDAKFLASADPRVAAMLLGTQSWLNRD